MQCAICLDEALPAEALAKLPCCTLPPTSTTQFCKRCIEIICEHGPGGVGRCPNCRKFLRVGEDGFVAAEETDQCGNCQQVRVIVHNFWTQRGRIKLCDACLLGFNIQLRYECAGCGRLQRIPHPMWRYQPSPIEFGHTTWFCHQRCDTHTTWRVAAQDAALVPADDAPETWGRRDEWLAAVREQRQRERHAPMRPPPARANRAGEALTLLVGFILLIAAATADHGVRLLALAAAAALTYFFWRPRR